MIGSGIPINHNKAPLPKLMKASTVSCIGIITHTFRSWALFRHDARVRDVRLCGRADVARKVRTAVAPVGQAYTVVCESLAIRLSVLQVQRDRWKACNGARIIFKLGLRPAGGIPGG
jgi:hypothetical protein